MLGKTISHYRITQKLGAGGMGVVYKAVDLKLERTVALKFLPTDMVVTDVDRERLLREARAASTLDHPNIGVIHGLEESEDRQFFIVMGYYDGMTLAERLDRGVVPIREALDLAIQIARGLSAAHARNIVHRDIKPSNVIITPDNTVKIVDFGLARVVASASATQSMSLTGTLPYMAPEQILGEPIDQRSDVWALGVVLVQMITGSHPFVRPNTAAMTFAILNQPPSALDAVPAPVRPVIYRTLSKKPEHRQANASELLNDLEAARALITSTPAPQEQPTITRSLTPRDLKLLRDNASTPRWSGDTTPWMKRAALVAMTLLVVLTGVLLLPPVREEIAGLVYASTEKHIAVLPFKNVGDPQFQPVTDGFSGSLTNRLSNLEAAQKTLWVVPASEVRIHDVNDASAALRILGATMVVEGTVAERNGAVYLTLALVDSKRVRQIGAVELEDEAGDIETLENKAIAHLARLMKLRVPEETADRNSNTTPKAYESYLKAIGLLDRYDKPGNIDQAVVALNAAVKVDGRFALAYATLCNAYRLKYANENDPASIPLAEANCRKALDLNDRLPTVYVRLAQLNTTVGKNEIALQQYEKAMSMNPRDVDTLIGLSRVNEKLNRPDEAERNLKQAIALRPDYWNSYIMLANFYNRQSRGREAIEQLKRVIELTPDNATAYSSLGAEYIDLADETEYPAAEDALKRSLQISPTYGAYSNLGYLYYMQKRYMDAVQAYQHALSLNDKDWVVWANLFVCYQWLNDETNLEAVRAKAIERLEQAIATTPQDAHMHSMLATLYATHDQGKALSHLHTALALNPKDSNVLSDAAVTFEAVGDRKQAVRYAHDSLDHGASLMDLQAQAVLQGVLKDPSFHPRGM
ncbi:MAG TPA: protein kinase [Candidatus Acidoferrum sp.]|nr:protein kinase [Candidatus Acidoferrum sp.]